MAEFRYRAFISYSWADAKWGNWLHRQLETYRTPAALVGREGRFGPVRTRLHPLFKDREEEAAGASIGAAVEAALAASEFLIVICSPNSARSKWVEHEIAWFKTHRDPEKVLALIVDGEPGSADAECFPPALTHRIGADLAVEESLRDPPLAADARITGDGKQRARLKLAAAMLGVGLDELVNRDERRRTIRTRIVVAASLALALVMSALAWVAIEARHEAERQRNEADGLVEFMLTDLRKKLEPVGRLDVLDAVGKRALAYYAQQRPGSLSADALGRRSRALHLVGEVSNLRGNSAAALQAFREAAATTRELLNRAPNDAQQVYDHAQSVFWVGYIAFERGETSEAEAQFLEYKRLADRLVALDPKNPKWQLESSYAETNLGVMYYNQSRFAEAETAFAASLGRIEAAAAHEKYASDRQIEIGATMTWLAKSKAALGKWREALDLNQQEAALYEAVLKRDPANAQAKNQLAIALQFVGEQLRNTGDMDGAIAAFDRSLGINAQLRRLEPGNTEWQETAVRGELAQAENMIYAGRLADSRGLLDEAERRLTTMQAKDKTNTIWSGELAAIASNDETMLAMARHQWQQAAAYAARTLKVTDGFAGNKHKAWAARVRRIAGDAQMQLGHTDRARQLWQEALKRLPASADGDEDRYILLKRLGRTTEADQVAARLDQAGFRNPAYLAARDG